MMQEPVMPGLTIQAIGVHDGNLLSCPMPMAVDRRDYAILNPIAIPHEFTCTQLVHYTENVAATEIGASPNNVFSFLSRPWWLTSTVSFKLSWWSPLPPHNWKDVVDANLPNIWNESNDIGNSSAFNGKSISGPLGFVISWKDILEQYAISRETNVHNVELRILGTFMYKKEIMYAIMVCTRGDAGVYSYPLINSEGTEAFAPMTGTTTEFIWKVYSTVSFGGNRANDVCWSWDHLSFGFNCPTSPFDIEPKYCNITTKSCTSFKPFSRSGQNENRWPQEMIASDEVIQYLERKVQTD